MHLLKKSANSRYVGLFLVAALVSACGGGDGDSSSNPSSAAQTTTPSSSNTAPSIQGQPGSAVLVGQAYTFQPNASDPNGDALTFSATNLPSWATLNAATGRISGTPSAADVASYSGITITVSDGINSVSLAPFAIAVTTVANGSATLSWVPPTQNSDGSPLLDLAGYEVRYGQSQNNLGQIVSLSNPSFTTYVIENLTSGTWYFAVTAVNSAGVVSPLSGVASKTIA